MNLLDHVNQGKTINDIQQIKNVVTSYLLIDYAIVESWSAGRVSVTLAHKIKGKPVVLTGVEVLSSGAQAFSSSIELIEGDVVQLFSSRSLVETVADFVAAEDRIISAYDLSTIKAVPVTDAANSLNRLTIAADGAYTLEGENYSISVAVDGSINLETSSTLSITATGAVTIEAATDLILKAVGSAAWCPNTLSNCLYTGAPHGGPVAGITGLKGS